MRLLAMALILAASSVAQAQTFVEQFTAIVVPTGPQLSGWASWARDVWPAITPAEVQRVKCSREKQLVDDVETTGATCIALVETDLTAAQFIAADNAGRVIRVDPANIAADGSSVTDVLGRYGPTFVSGANLSALATLASTTLGIPVGQLFRVDVYYDSVGDPDADPPVAPGWRARGALRATKTDEERLLCLKTGDCGRLID